jgi:hypothetical protein
MERRRSLRNIINFLAAASMLWTGACTLVDVPESRNVQIPSPTVADQRKPAINERPDSVMYLPLGEDVLVPEVAGEDNFPSEMVGPFELRGETLAGALQLILADYDISLAFETEQGLTRRITVANLRGDLGKVVNQVCSLANLYCSYEDGTITVKDTQTFTVTLPPLGSGEEESFLEDVSAGLDAILNGGAATGGTTTNTSIVDPTTRTIVYNATQRTADIAARYFQRLRANTAMIVFETYIWEVSLNSGNSTGIDWTKLTEIGKFNTGIAINGGVGADFTDPISIGLPTTSGTFNGTSGDLIQFLSQFGAVKTISQPQITVLSGSEAELRVADTQNYVSQIATTLSEGQATTSVNTDSVDTGFTLTIGSSWDKSTVYANVAIELTDVKQIDDFAFSDTPDPDDPDATGTQTRIQLPQTSERQLTTQIRVRPGDSVLIAGLVRENDNFNERGPGFMQPVVPDSRTAQTENLELVILLRPRVIVYTASNDKRYMDYALKKHKLPGTGVEVTSPEELGEKAEYENKYTGPARAAVTSEQESIPSGVAAPLTKTPSVDPVAVKDPVPVIKPVAPAPSVPPVEKSTPAPAASAKPVPLAPVTSAPAPTMTPEPATVSKAPTAPSPAASPAATPSSEARFRRGSGFSSSGMAPVYPAPPSSGTQPSAPRISPYTGEPIGNETTTTAPGSSYGTYDVDSAAP